MTAMTQLEASIVSTARAGASRTAYCPDVPSLDEPDELLFDFLDHAFIRAVHTLPTIGAVKWNRGGSLTALSYDYYTTVSYGPVILLYNGYISPGHIPAGATINIPDVSTLKTKLQRTKKGTITRV